MFKSLIEKASAWLDRFGHMPLWFVISIALLLLVAPINPVLVASYLWFICKISAAAALGYGFDWAAFRDEDPSNLQGVERSLAQTRRSTLIAAAMIAAGLIG